MVSRKHCRNLSIRFVGDVVSYLVACMLSAFVAGLMVGVMIESSARKFFKGDDDETR